MLLLNIRNDIKLALVWLHNAFLKATAFLHNWIHPAYLILQSLNTIVQSDAVDIAVEDLLPAGLGEKIITAAKTLLPKILIDAGIADQCASLTNANDIIQCAITNLRKLNPTQYQLKMLTIGSMLSNDLSDGKLSLGEIIAIVNYLQENSSSAPSLSAEDQKALATVISTKTPATPETPPATPAT